MNSSSALTLTKIKSKILKENAFSLIEVLTVVAIIGILALIAIPTFITQKDKGQDASAKAVLDNAKKAMLAGSSGDITNYTSSDEAKNKMASLENNYEFITSPITTQKNTSTGKIYINVYLTGEDDNEASSSNHAVSGKLSTLSSSGNCISLTINNRNEETWSNDDTTCGSNSSSTDTNDNSSPNPSGPPTVPIITPNTVDIGDRSPTFDVSFTSGNSLRCRTGNTGSYTTVATTGSVATYTPAGVPLDNGSHKISCYQVKSSGNYSNTTNFTFTVDYEEEVPVSNKCNSTLELAIAGLRYYDNLFSQALSSNGVAWDTDDSIFANAHPASITAPDENAPCEVDGFTSDDPDFAVDGGFCHPSPTGSGAYYPMYTLVKSNQFCFNVLFNMLDEDYHTSSKLHYLVFEISDHKYMIIEYYIGGTYNPQTTKVGSCLHLANDEYWPDTIDFSMTSTSSPHGNIDWESIENSSACTSLFS